MAQAYRAPFARIYDMQWGAFAERVAPLIREFYEAQPAAAVPRAVLDVGCGTGQLALSFLEQGYRVIGLDLSEPMLRYARQRCQAYVARGDAHFVQADAAQFSLARDSFGLAVATYDMLNHLPDFAALKDCFACVFPVLAAGGTFIFDLNTVSGLRRWSNLSVQDNGELFLLQRGIYDEEAGRATVSITGFLDDGERHFQRFDEIAYNTSFELEAVRQALLKAGWVDVYCARVNELSTPLEEPEEEGRVFFVAHKG